MRDLAERGIDALYAEPLDRFIAARDELARQVQRESPERSQEIRKLPKPTLPAWVVNQLYRQEPGRFRALLTAGERLQQAQRVVLGGGVRAAFDQAIVQEKACVEALLPAARELLTRAGRQHSGAAIDRVRDNLRALARSPEAKAFQGRLSRDLPPPGLETLVGPAATSVVPRPPETKQAAPAPAAKSLAPAQDRVKEQQAAQAEQERQRELAAAKTALEAAETQLEAARKAHDSSQEAARASSDKVVGAERRARELRRIAERALSEADAAGDAAVKAREAEAQARLALTEASERLQQRRTERDALAERLARLRR